MDAEFELDFGSGFVSVPPPKNWKATRIQLIYTNGSPSAQLQSINYEWVSDNATKLNAYYKAGVQGGLGIYFGVPLRIKSCSNPLLGKTILFDGIVVLSDDSATFECDKVIAPIRDGKIDYLNEYAKSFTFSDLKNYGVITSADYKKTPYVISELPNYSQTALMSITLFITLKELYDVIKEVGDWIGKLTAALTEEATQLATNTPSTIAIVAGTILYLTYLFLIIVALVNLIKSLVQNVIQSKKYKLCMRQADIFKKGCQFMNLIFVSSIYGEGLAAGYSGQFVDATWMPKKVSTPTKTNPFTLFDRPFDEAPNGSPDPNSNGYYEGTFFDFLQDMKEEYNAEIVIDNGTLYFEERNSFNTSGAYQLPNTGEVGYTLNYPEPHGTNASELAANYKLEFQLDDSDINTKQKFKGTNVVVNISPLTPAVPPIPTPATAMILKRRSSVVDETITFRCALAKRKEYLTEVENLLQGVVSVMNGIVNTISSIVNGIVNGINAVLTFVGAQTIPTWNPPQIAGFTQRIGWLEISDDSFSIPKSFIGIQVGGDWEIHPNNENVMNAANLMANFHGKNLATRGNQWLTYTNKKFPMCCADYTKISKKNVFTTADNKIGKFDSLTWWLDSEQAVEVNYRINSNFTNNLKENITIDHE